MLKWFLVLKWQELKSFCLENGSILLGFGSFFACMIIGYLIHGWLGAGLGSASWGVLMILVAIIKWFVKLMISNWRKARFVRNNYNELAKRKCRDCGAPVTPIVGKDYISLQCTKKCGAFDYMVCIQESK